MDALIQLEPVLRSKKAQLTPQEVYILQSWRDRAKRNFYVGGLAGSVTSWLVTKRLPKQARLLLSVGVGVVSGLTLIVRSMNSSVEYMLSLQGTRVQGELAQIMLKNHHNHPWVHQHVSKYFYPEVVYTDSSADKALYRWRYRNSSGDLVISQTQTQSSAEPLNSTENEIKMTTPETKQVHASADDNIGENLFDLILGLPESTEEVPGQPDAPGVLSRRQTRRQKRLHRRRRHGHHEELEI